MIDFDVAKGIKAIRSQKGADDWRVYGTRSVAELLTRTFIDGDGSSRNYSKSTITRWVDAGLISAPEKTTGGSRGDEWHAKTLFADWISLAIARERCEDALMGHGRITINTIKPYLDQVRAERGLPQISPPQHNTQKGTTMASIFDDPEQEKRLRFKEIQKRREAQKIRSLEDRELEKQGRAAEQEIAKRSMFQRLEQVRQQAIQRYTQIKNTLLQNHLTRQQQIREQSRNQNRMQTHQQSHRDYQPAQAQQRRETRAAEREAREQPEQQEQPAQKSQNQFSGGFTIGQGKSAAPPMSRSQVEEALKAGDHKLMGKNLAGADLSGLDLRGQFLRGTNFQGCNLDGADFSHSELQGADLQKASAKGARFEATDLSNTKAAGANFSGAEFERSNMQHSDLREADFSEARFSETSLDSADLKGADFSGARSQSTSFSKADLLGAQLANAGLEFSGRDGGPDSYDTSESCRFQDAKMHEASLPPSWEQNRPDGPLYGDPSGISQRETELAGKLAEIQERYDAKILHSTGMPDARWRAESQLQAHAAMCNERASVIEDVGKNAGTSAERDRFGRQAETAKSQAEASQSALDGWRSRGQVTDPQYLAQVRSEAGFTASDNQLLQNADAEHAVKEASKERAERGQGADYNETIVASVRERRQELSSGCELSC